MGLREFYTANQFQMWTRGEGVNKSENVMDIINGGSRMKRKRGFKEQRSRSSDECEEIKSTAEKRGTSLKVKKVGWGKRDENNSSSADFYLP